MAEDWLSDVRRYDAGADEGVVAAIVRYCGIALRKVDSSLVSFSDPKETARVRENYCKKKLGLTHSDAELDSAIAAVGETMQADRTKNRVTVYYLLADRLGKLGVFGGAGGSAVAGLAAAAAAIPVAAVASSAAAAQAAPVRPQTAYSGSTAGRDWNDDTPDWRWIAIWAGGGILGAAFIATVLGTIWARPDAVPVSGPATQVVPAVTPVVAAPPAIPTGAGVIAADRDGKPMLTVYFDTGASAVSNDLTTAASAVKAHLDDNPTATLAVSGFNDPTGNAAANAELSKNRAQAVKAALEKLGIAAERVALEKPAETTDTAGDNTNARRVEVVVKE